MIAPPPGFEWRRSISDAQSHLFAVDATPDEEGILTAVCAYEVMAFRVASAEYGSYCYGCLPLAGAHQADRLEARAAVLAARQHTELQDGA